MLRIALACLLFVAFLLVATSNASAQDAPPDTPEPTAQEKATALFGEGKALEDAKDFDGAIAKYKEAFETFPDPGLWVRIGQAYQLKGNENDRDVESYKKAIESYQKFLELVPEGDPNVTEQINTRISDLEKAIAEEEEAKAKQAEEEKQAKIAEAQAKRDEDERERKKKAELEGMRPAIDALVIAGLDQDTTLGARLMAGGFLGWKLFALEGHLAFDGQFPLASKNVGTSGRSISLDLGLRVGKGAKNFTGPFVSAGGGFGIFSGSPRERVLKDDPVCQGTETCQFDIDRAITGRLGFGYGFAANKKTTVAARIDVMYWLLSVDGEQPTENVPAALVEKPQQGFSILLGLEFMRWL